MEEKKLIDICEFIVDCPHSTAKDEGSGYPLIRTPNVGKGRLILQGVHRVNELVYKTRIERAKPSVGDIILAREAPVGNAAIIMPGQQVCLGQRVVLIRAKRDFVNPMFLVYYLLSNEIQHKLKNNANGAVVAHLNMDEIRNLFITIPDINIQDKIASLLSSLDDKIEVNRRINDNLPIQAFIEVLLIWMLTSLKNDNLEQQAQALFKSWFVDFEPFRDQPFVESELGMIPQGWRVVSLDDMTSKFGTGLNPRKNFVLGHGNNYYVTIKNMGSNRVYIDDRCDKIDDEAIEKINKRSKLSKGDLLFSGIGTIGRVALITETPTNWNTSESIFNMHPDEGFTSEFLYILLLSDVFQTYVKIHAQGGVQQGIRMASLKAYTMAVPDVESMKLFDRILSPIINCIKENDKENDRLTSLRDTLLPRLMSGELKVNEIENSI